MLFVVSLLTCDPGRKHHPYFSPRFTHESLIRRLFSLSFPGASMIFPEFFHAFRWFSQRNMAPPPAEPQVDARAGAHREVTATLRWDAASVAELEGVPGVSQGARGFRKIMEDLRENHRWSWWLLIFQSI